MPTLNGSSATTMTVRIINFNQKSTSFAYNIHVQTHWPKLALGSETLSWSTLLKTMKKNECSPQLYAGTLRNTHIQVLPLFIKFFPIFPKMFYGKNMRKLEKREEYLGKIGRCENVSLHLSVKKFRLRRFTFHESECCTQQLK